MSSDVEQSYYAGRLLIAKIFACFCLGLLLIRLWYLQGMQGAYYRNLSENNRTRLIRTVAPRGAIYDRQGRLLVRNRPAFNVALMLEDTPDLPGTIKKLAAITGRDEVQLKAQFNSRRKSLPFEPKVVMYDISREELAKVKVYGHSLPGVIVSQIPTRAYPNDSIAAQLFGYIREISKVQMNIHRDEGYKLGDLIGQTGLERQMESALRGKAGYIEVEVDARGNRRDELRIVESIPGNDLHLTIDLDLQHAAEEALGEFRGAVVALDPRNGEVLVLASTPSFDANIFSGQMLAEEWEQLAQDPEKPLRNRAIANIYPPGSTLKLLWAVAGLAEKKISSGTHFNCPGYVVLNKRRYHCHKRSGHGSVNLEMAVTLSCNAYFYQLGHRLGIEHMSKYLKMFGFGKPSGISLPGEERGTLPSRAWKEKRFGERWYPGDSVPISIGQGYIVATPLQLASMVSAIASDGKRFRPMLVKKIVDSQTGEEEDFKPELIGRLSIDKAIFSKVRRHAGNVVNHPRGTGKRAKLEGIEVAGKTGTAQVVRLGKGTIKDHAWFVSFAPAEKPTIALAVIVEHSGHGGVFAAPVARQVLEVYFRKLGLLQEPEAGEAKEEDAAKVNSSEHTVQEE